MKRREHRSIELDATPRSGPQSLLKPFYRVIEDKNGTTTVIRRQGTTLYTRTARRTQRASRVEKRVTMVRESAIIRYKQILDRTHVSEDNTFNEAPWRCCDGWEHSTLTYEGWVDRVAGINPPGGVPTRQWFRGYRNFVMTRDGDWLHIVSAQSMLDNLDAVEAYARANGASKQVAAELRACQFRRDLAQLGWWYSHGWEYWLVECRFRGEEASVHGVDDATYATQEVRYEIADEIASSLRRRGYLIRGRPRRKRDKKSDYHERVQGNLNSQNWRT